MSHRKVSSRPRRMSVKRAQDIASKRSWTFHWEHDESPDWSGIEDAKEVLHCVLRDENGHVLDSLGGIGMSGNYARDQRFGREIERDMIENVLAEQSRPQYAGT